MAKDEITSYQKSAKCCNPIMFWRISGYCFFHLERLPRKYLCAQGRLVSSERVFSTSGNILSAERSCLDLDALDAMIFLKKNASDSCDFLQEYIWLYQICSSPKCWMLRGVSLKCIVYFVSLCLYSYWWIWSQNQLCYIFLFQSKVPYDISDIDQNVLIHILHGSNWLIHSPNVFSESLLF